MKKGFSILLALLLLFSNLGFAVGTHYCGGTAVKSKLIFAEFHLDCGMSGMESCEKPSGPVKHSIQRLPCCENVYNIIESENLKKAEAEFSFEKSFQPIFVFFFVAFSKYDQVDHNLEYNDTSPPFLDLDLLSQNQAFLL